MLSLMPALERVPSGWGPFSLWPVEADEGGLEHRWLFVRRTMTAEQVGAAMFGFLVHSPFGEEGKMPSTAPAALSMLTGLSTYASPGGLLLRDCLAGTRAAPGCCCDLYEWRDWLGALDKHPIDLGHDPAPWVEYEGDVVRVWSDGADSGERTAAHTDVDRGALPAMFQSVQRDLAGFLEALRDWAGQIDPGQADALVAAFDAGLAISEPLQMSEPLKMSA